MSFLHDIWNPWHGCVKCSEGCQNCYMYFLDRMRDQNGVQKGFFTERGIDTEALKTAMPDIHISFLSENSKRIEKQSKTGN